MGQELDRKLNGLLIGELESTVDVYYGPQEIEDEKINKISELANSSEASNKEAIKHAIKATVYSEKLFGSKLLSEYVDKDGLDRVRSTYSVDGSEESIEVPEWMMLIMYELYERSDAEKGIVKFAVNEFHSSLEKIFET